MPEFDAVIAPKNITATADLGPDALLEFTFDANRVTPEWFSKQEHGLAEQDVLTIARALSEIISSWNLTAAGEPIPVSTETLSRFPISHLGKLMEGIAEQPSRAEGEVSGRPLREPPTDSTATPQQPQNGAATSELPKPSESLSPT